MKLARGLLGLTSRHLSPVQTGLASAFGGVGLIAACLFAGTARLTDAPPSAELLRQLAGVGVGLLIAYSVAVAAVERIVGAKRPKDEHENWLGFVTGLGLCGLIAVGVALGLAEHRDAGYANLLDDLGLWWVVGSVVMLGTVVATLPISNYWWRGGDAKPD